MKFQKLLDELKCLALPSNQYAITSSGTLAIRGIREAQDLDILVSDKLWQELSQKYAVQKTGSFESINIGNIQILGQGSKFRDQGIASVDELIQKAEIIEDYPFVGLEYVKKFKQNLGREKDLKDIELINQYLSLR